MLQTKSTQSCTEGTGLRRLGRPNAPTGHTPVCCRMYQFRGCTQESRVTTEWQTNCCCENTHVCRRIDQPKVAPENQGLQGFWPTNCCRERNHTHTHTHTRASCRKRKFRVAPEDQGLRSFGQRRAAVSIHTVTRLLQNKPIQGCNQGSQFTRVWLTNCCCEHTDVRCRKY